MTEGRHWEAAARWLTTPPPRWYRRTLIPVFAAGLVLIVMPWVWPEPVPAWYDSAFTAFMLCTVTIVIAALGHSYVRILRATPRKG